MLLSGLLLLSVSQGSQCWVKHTRMSSGMALITVLLLAAWMLYNQCCRAKGCNHGRMHVQTMTNVLAVTTRTCTCKAGTCANTCLLCCSITTRSEGRGGYILKYLSTTRSSIVSKHNTSQHNTAQRSTAQHSAAHWQPYCCALNCIVA